MQEVNEKQSGRASKLQSWLRPTTIVGQISNVFGLFTVLVLVLATLAIANTYRIDQRVHILSDLTEVAFLTTDMSRALTSARDTLVDQPEASVQGVVADVALATADVEELVFSSSHVDEGLHTRAQTVAAELAVVEQATAQLAATTEAQRVQGEVLQPSIAAIEAALADIDTMNSYAATRVNTDVTSIEDAIQSMMVLLSIAAIIAIGLTIFGKRFVARRFALPIAMISDASEQIATGSVDVKIPGQKREDEIGTLAKSLDVLRAVQQEVALRAEAELEEQRKVQEDRERERAERAAFVQSLADKFEITIGDVANQVASASAQLHDAADELAKNVETSSSRVMNAGTNLEEASSGMTGAAAATDEFVLSISEVSRQAATSSERAQKAAAAASDADETIGAMTDSATKISQIVEVIAGIAQRTNLLALNASIEAARGSDAGRGFAVVAAEVKELAAQTSRATAEAEELIHLVQDSTGKSASALSTIADEVIELQSASTMIASAVDQQAVAGQDLAKSIDMAARNTELVSSGFREVSELAASTGSTASQLRDSSGHLIKQSDRLRDQVAEFLQHVRAA
ncbi:methyl-accepting chemotaxis protein [Aurantiacibacter gangjinensis]|uniref:methyl-accepting chemotaxis protein n=1 Tax=Aurantiacibacter gangjinensis TaxID=502682 RepID=UPI00069934F3|nr:methyl-accepting chemotaxis protein [Aurantiacibacter gangjinensis]APE27119.1 Methyl-accepting chemotaxis protein [Aurantiacibacter gangjinensis]